jgi:hypothetical protein
MGARTVSAVALAFLAANGLMVLFLVAFPSAIDELQHLSYIRWEEAHPSLFPRYEALRTLAPDLVHWDGAGRLSHPSIYYLAMAVFDRAFHSVVALRLANLALALAGATILLRAGFEAIADEGQRAVYFVLVVLFPKTGLVAGMINNDNVALVAVALGFLGMVRRQRWLVALGLALAGWTKLTALLMLGFGFVFTELLERPRLRREHLVVLLGATAGLIPSIVNLARYGELVWRSPARPVPLEPLSSVSFVGRAIRQLGESWSALEPSNAFAELGLIVMLAVGVVACVKGWQRWPVAVGLMLATIPVLVLQFWFLRDTAVRNNFVDQFNSRYYYGVWPGFALGAAQLWGDYRGPVKTALTIAIGFFLFMGSAMACIGMVILTGGSLH